MRIVGVLLGLTVLIVGFMFASLNAAPIHVQYLIGSKDISLSVLVLILLSAGILMGSFFSALAYFRLRLNHRQLKKQLHNLEKEVSQLRLLSVREN